jgi:hypothetical protein
VVYFGEFNSPNLLVHPCLRVHLTKQTRLTHGAGVVALGIVMDTIADRFRDRGVPTRAAFAADLERLRPVCRWSEGYWEFGPGMRRKWDEIQNTPNDANMLMNYFRIQYKIRVWDLAASEAQA